jgi:hypothetical protein
LLAHRRTSIISCLFTGAYETGVRAAVEILQLLEGKGFPQMQGNDVAPPLASLLPTLSQNNTKTVTSSQA